jgi:transcriptional regulator with XRE-family HTH domain
MKVLTSSALVRDLRERSGASQRDLGRRAGTSGPTIAAYEAGTKEARLSTLERLADAWGHRVSTSLQPRDSGGALRARRRLRSLALAAATADALVHDWKGAKGLGTANLRRISSVVGGNLSHASVVEWRELIDRGPEAVRAALLDPSEHGDDLRQMQPFAGLLTHRERRLVLAAAEAWAGGS